MGFITIKTTPKALTYLRLIAAYTGEKQYKIHERLLEDEFTKVKTANTEQPAPSEILE